jgi:hypothetical protein
MIIPLEKQLWYRKKSDFSLMKIHCVLYRSGCDLTRISLLQVVTSHSSLHTHTHTLSLSLCCVFTRIWKYSNSSQFDTKTSHFLASYCCTLLNRTFTVLGFLRPDIRLYRHISVLYLLHLWGCMQKAYHVLRPFCALLCVTVWVLTVPDSSTRALWKIPAETPRSEAKRNVTKIPLIFPAKYLCHTLRDL